jgi:hypothetical protein
MVDSEFACECEEGSGKGIRILFGFCCVFPFYLVSGLWLIGGRL